MKSVRALPCLVSLSAILLAGCFHKEETPPAATEKPAALAGVDKPAPDKPAEVSFTRSIKPLLSEKCTICHNMQVLPNRPNFETREGVMKSQVIVPGKPDESLILTSISEAHGADKAMPPVSHRLSKQEMTMLRNWIAQGADWPAGEAGRVTPAFIPEE